MNAPAKKSEANWEEVMRNPAVTEITTMVLPNTAEKHDEKTTERLLKNFQDRAPRLMHLLNLSMAEVNFR